MSEVDWLLLHYRTQMKMIRQFHRLVKMPDSRLTKKIFLWDRHLNETGEIFSWSSEIKTILDSCAMPDIYSNNTKMYY